MAQAVKKGELKQKGEEKGEVEKGESRGEVKMKKKQKEEGVKSKEQEKEECERVDVLEEDSVQCAQKHLNRIWKQNPKPPKGFLARVTDASLCGGSENVLFSSLSHTPLFLLSFNSISCDF